MKILVSFDNRIRPDSTGIYLVRAFKQLGHEVDHVLPENIGSIERKYDFYLRCDDGLRGGLWNPELHPSHYFCIDTHIETDWRIKLAKEGQFDTISVVHSQGLNLNWGKEAHWIPVGCDPEMHYQGDFVKDKIYDGCFIGNLHAQAGKRVEMLDAFFSKCPVFFFGNRTPQEAAKKYAQSRIVFNCSINKDCNMRVFEAMCSGSCLLTDRVPDMEALGFIDGIHYFGYSSKQELMDLTEKLLKEDAIREQVAAKGRELVLKHTYADRMKTVLDLIPVGCPI